MIRLQRRLLYSINFALYSTVLYNINSFFLNLCVLYNFGCHTSLILVSLDTNCEVGLTVRNKITFETTKQTIWKDFWSRRHLNSQSLFFCSDWEWNHLWLALKHTPRDSLARFLPRFQPAVTTWIARDRCSVCGEPILQVLQSAC